MISDPINTGHAISGAQQAMAAGECVGFHFGNKGTHTSRTLMLEELKTVLTVTAAETDRDTCRRLIIEENVLGKRTVATRRLTAQRLAELYALDSSVLLFRIFRRLWADDEAGRPLLAALLALGRDPLFRLTAPPVLQMRPGEELRRQLLTDALIRTTGSRFNEAVVAKIVRNAASSWTQSGHLEGHSHKIRRTVSPTPAVVTFALLLGYVLGARGSVLFNTLWSKVLDTGTQELIRIATDAKRMGYLDLRVAGGVVEVSFSRLLTEGERQVIRGTH